PSIELLALSVTKIVSSKQATLRHTKVSAYGCFLPDLTRFTNFCYVRPICQHHFFQAELNSNTPPLGIQPCCSDCRLQGIASSPSSAWRRMRDLNPRNAYTFT